jgi:hypothetical protein
MGDKNALLNSSQEMRTLASGTRVVRAEPRESIFWLIV